MKPQNKILQIVFPAAAMLILILDSKTALQGAAEGLDICLKTIIPSLLPFFVFSILLTNACAGQALPFLRPVGRLCGIPKNAESLLLTGFLGGYPVGAQCVAQTYREGLITKADAHRMLAFCSNAGPAFIFGVAGRMFTSTQTGWILWAIHLLSALMVGMVLPGKSKETVQSLPGTDMDLPKALQSSVQILSGVCGWVILFRVITAFLTRWILWLIPYGTQAALAGTLEIANGIIMLGQLESEAIRFILASALLGFGGLCVGMQTISVTGNLGTGWYFPGKILQGIYSITFAVILELGITNILFPITAVISVACTAFSLLFFSKQKKQVAFSERYVYNG